MRFSRRPASGLGLLAGLLLAFQAPLALAHPHVWVQMRENVVFDAERRFVALEQAWTFDHEYSAFATLNLDTNGDGVPAPDRLAELAKTQMASLSDHAFFTEAKVNGRAAGFGPPTDVGLTYRDKRLTLRFRLPVAAPAIPRILVLLTYDPSFFVAYNLDRDQDALRLSGAPKGCALNITRPKIDADEGRQILPDADAAELARASAVAVDFRTHILVACP